MSRLLRNKRVSASIVMLFLLHVAGPTVVRRATGTPFGSMGMPYVGPLFSFCVLGALLHVYGRLWDPLPVNSWKKLAVTSLPFVIVVSLGCLSLYSSLPSVRAQEILAGAEFAHLPESASQIKVLTWSTPMSGEKYLRFRANPADIEAFIAQSPILENAEYEEYSDKRMRLFFSDPSARRLLSHDDHEYITRKPTAPPWYVQEIRHAAGRYRILPKAYNHAGELIIDKRSNLLFVKLIIG